MSNSLDPDQAQHFVGPDLGPNCLQRLSADDTNRQSALDIKDTHKNNTSAANVFGAWRFKIPLNSELKSFIDFKY